MSWAAVASIGASVVGGAMSKGSGGGGSSTSKVELDPRMQDLLYGNYTGGGVLGDMNNLFKDQFAQGGLHPLQTAGLEAQRQVLTHPSFTQGFDDMRSLGRGLMGAGVARNPMSGWQPGALRNGSGGAPRGGYMGDSYGSFGSIGGFGQGGGIMGGMPRQDMTPTRPGGPGFSYDLFSGNLMDVTRPVTAYQPTTPAPAPAPSPDGGGSLTQDQFDQMYREYLRLREMEQNAGPGTGSY